MGDDSSSDDWDPNAGCISSDNDTDDDRKPSAADQGEKASTSDDELFWQELNGESASSSRRSSAAGGAATRVPASSLFTQQHQQLHHQQRQRYPCDDDSDEHDDDTINPLHSFYHEASLHKQQRPPKSPSASSLHSFSQSSTANLSLAELSRMEESLLSQTSHHDEEVQRQRVKVERKRKRADGSSSSVTKKGKKKAPLTARQLKRKKEYNRFKYRKELDLSQEVDVGGSMEFLMRKKLNEEGEQRRLKRVATEMERERVRKEMEERERIKREEEEYWGTAGEVKEDVLSSSSSSSSDASLSSASKKKSRRRKGAVKSEEPVQKASTVDVVGNAQQSKTQPKDDSHPTWNYLKEGYTTMPSRQARKLPYYVYSNLANMMIRDDGSAMSGVSDIDGDGSEVDQGRSSKKRRAKTETNLPTLLSGKSSVASSTVKTKIPTKQPKKTKYFHEHYNNKSSMTHSFPLHFNQVKPNFDMHGFNRTNVNGTDRMVLAHGRNAKRLWTRLVAGGGNFYNISHDHVECIDVNETKTKLKRGDSASDVSASSSSSKSSTRSYFNPSMPGNSDYRSNFNSQSTFGATGVDTANDSAITSQKQNHVFRLMSLVHSLPKVAHRNRFFLKVAQELGTNRRLWETELKSWVDSHAENSADNLTHNTISLSPEERWVLKSFLGVDGNISPGPFWASDPTAQTNPGALKVRLHYFRSVFLPRLRRLIADEKKKKVGISDTSDTIDGSRADVDSVVGGETPHFTKEDTEQNEMKVTHPTAAKTETHDNGDSLNGIENETTANAVTSTTKQEGGMEGDPDEENTAITPSVAEEVSEFSRSLMDLVQPSVELGGVDKYAKVIHYSNIDITNIPVALALFLDHLSASKAQLSGQIETASLEQRRNKLSARENIGLWHETIDSYLTMAEHRTRPFDTTYFKRDGKYPNSAPLAQAVLARQYYAANGGGIGCGKKRQTRPKSVWRVQTTLDNDEEEDDYNSDESLELAPDNDALEQQELRIILFAAKDIAKRGKEHLTNEHLDLFTAIHLTTGIGMIAEHLTPRASEIVSRTCNPDNPQSRTPFDLIGNMLRELEDVDNLISVPLEESARWQAQGKVIDEVLVQSMENAAKVFRKCTEMDPHNVEHWSWYVATLLGIVCVSSGMSLSEGTGVQRNMTVKMESDDANNRKRYQLDSMNKRRGYAAKAMLDFLQFAQTQNCPVFHLSLSSMLEWKRAMTLMHRPEATEFVRDTRRLHAYHVSIVLLSLLKFRR